MCASAILSVQFKMYLDKRTTLLLLGLAIMGTVQSRSVKNQPALSIIGGEVATPHEAPYIVRLGPYRVDAGSGEFFDDRCGGSLISEEYILTAKHCLSWATGVFVYFGDHDANNTDDGEIEIEVTDKGEFLQHDTADIAILKINPPISLSPTIQKVTLPLKNDAQKSYVGRTGTAYGWGLISDKGRTDVSQFLRKVDVTVISNSQCDVELDTHTSDRTQGHELCTSGNAASDAKGTCGGDSGGPFMIDNVQVGITSWGPSKCTAGGPSVYVSVGKFLDWIEQTTQISLP